MSAASADRSEPRWELYRLLSEPVRLRLLALAGVDELTIGELAELLGESQPKVSRHIKPLRRAGLLAVRRQGTRSFVRLAEAITADPVVADALEAGEGLSRADGSLARVGKVIAARDSAVRAFFDNDGGLGGARPLAGEAPAYVAALRTLVAPRGLAVDVGTGDGALLDVLAPVFDEVIGLDRSAQQLARAGERLRARGYTNVKLRRGEYDALAFRRELEERGGADAVFAARVLHHAPRPLAAMTTLAHLLRPDGTLVVLDYQLHEDERLREQQADVWLGFERRELLRLAKAAGLQGAQVAPIPSSWCGEGLDGHLDWQMLSARRAA